MSFVKSADGVSLHDLKHGREEMQRGVMLDAQTAKSVILRHDPSNPLVVPPELYDELTEIPELAGLMSRVATVEREFD